MSSVRMKIAYLWVGAAFAVYLKWYWVPKLMEVLSRG